MNEYLFIIVLGTLGLLSTITSSKGGLFDNRFIWYKRLNAKGWFVTAIGLLIIGLSIMQSIRINKFNQFEKDFQIKLKKESDSTIAAEINTGVDSSRRKLFNDLSEALAKQKIILDTVTKTVKSLRDSVKTIVIKTENKTPELLILSNGINLENVGKDLRFNFSFTSLEAASLIKYINLFVEIIFINGKTDTIKRKEFITSGTRISQNINLTMFSTMSNIPNEIKEINFAFWGIYTAINNIKELRYRTIYTINISTKKFYELDFYQAEDFFRKYNIEFNY